MLLIMTNIEHGNKESHINYCLFFWSRDDTSLNWVQIIIQLVQLMSKCRKKSLLKMIDFCNMIALFSILKQLRTVVIVKTWRLICCVENYNHYELILLPHFQNKIVCIRSLYQFTWDLHIMQIFLLIWLKFSWLQKFL